MGEQGRPEFLVRVKEDYFRAGEDFFKSIEVDELIAYMDGLGVERCVLSVAAERPEERVLEFAKKHPERFALAASIDPRRGMKAIWRLEQLVREHPVAASQIV